MLATHQLFLEPVDEANTTTSKPFRAIQYLGSKMRLVAEIGQLVAQFASKGQVVCDLFCGSGVVSHHLASTYDIVACDIQRYSALITSAVLNPTHCSVTHSDAFLCSVRDGETLATLRAIYAPLIDFEESCLAEAQAGDAEPLLSFTENASEYIFDNETPSTNMPVELRKCFERVRRNRRRHNRSPLPLATHYYGGIYFSYAQSVVIDALLESIHSPGSHEGYKSVLLGSLLSTTSTIVNTVGKQFAQPMKLRTRTGGAKALLLQRTIRDRSYDVFDTYRQALAAYQDATAVRYCTRHEVVCSDYRTFLDTCGRTFACIYADPPYTIDHYSRFYHVLETIAVRDYPSLDRITRSGGPRTMRGLYRSGRHQSPFCVPSEVISAFDSLFAGAVNCDAPLVLSYSPFNPGNHDRPRLLTLDQITQLARNYYPRVAVVDAEPHSHRKLHSTQKNRNAIDKAESFIVCSFA